MRRIISALINTVFPNRCPACGSLFYAPAYSVRHADSFVTIADLPVHDRFPRLMAAFACPACASNFSPVASPMCSICGRMFTSSVGDDHVCSDCASHVAPFTAVRSAGIYEGALMHLIHAVKYRRRLRLTRPLGLLLFYDFLRYYAEKQITMVLPVPLHLSRMRSRGFNQSLMLLGNWRKMNRMLKTPAVDFTVDPGLLIRHRNTRSQTGLKRAQRRTNIRAAFCVTAPERIMGQNILLVDDVYTTGSTVGECAAELKKNGAGDIYVLTLARAV